MDKVAKEFKETMQVFLFRRQKHNPKKGRKSVTMALCLLSFIFVLRFHLHCEMTLQRNVQAWLDSESEYRLDVQKAKDALEGATFARNAYEKWETANQQEKHTPKNKP
jgi:hypothetical protein